MSDEVSPRTSPFHALPEGCISSIISLTSPKDACRVAAVSLAFKSAADSDTTWDRFLPPNHNDVVSRASPPLPFSTKKHLYFLLRDSTLLLDEGTMSLEFNGKTGKASYTLGARKLQIGSSEDPKHWEWTSLPQSRFAEVAKLRSINRLEIRGVMQARLLSPNTTYVAWLVYRFNRRGDQLDVRSKASIKFVKEDGTETAGETSAIYLGIPIGRSIESIDGRLSWAVEDGWHEIELGEFAVGAGDSFDVHIEVSETERLNVKKGLIVEGIALRPTYLPRFPNLASLEAFCWSRAFEKLDDLSLVDFSREWGQ